VERAAETGIDGVIPRRVHDLPGALAGATRVGPYSSARPGALLRVVPGVGSFLARDGSTLEYVTEQDADEAAVEALLGGGVLGALIHQRGDLPLHATTLVPPAGTGAVAIAGGSGAGKSTTAYELIRRGWTLLSDDLTRISLRDGAPVAWPGRSKLRLRADACASFGIDVASLAPAPGWRDKYALELPGWDRPTSLSAIVVLEDADGGLRLDSLGRSTAARTLAGQTYRLHYVAALGRTRRHLELVAATAAATAVLRARGRATVVQVAQAIERAVPSSGP